VKVCPNCGEEHPERARFCLSCGRRLDEAAPAEERKVVTVLFCDLVGFTARSDNADPEDVKAALRPFHARIKREIELFGGTLDKFIGDAALGVFGSPVAHEDDPSGRSGPPWPSPTRSRSSTGSTPPWASPCAPASTPARPWSPTAPAPRSGRP
jgi:class 3 adenylate cyclase